MKLVKTSLHIKLKQTHVENRLHISTESAKEGFNDTVLTLKRLGKDFFWGGIQFNRPCGFSKSASSKEGKTLVFCDF